MTYFYCLNFLCVTKFALKIRKNDGKPLIFMLFKKKICDIVHYKKGAPYVLGSSCQNIFLWNIIVTKCV